ncbi:hypothetical protein OROMI_025237 [Orobanche minor]
MPIDGGVDTGKSDVEIEAALGRRYAHQTGDSLFKPEFWPKFACLKELEFWNFSFEGKVLRICSTSLERIDICSFEQGVILNGEFDVPNLRTFVLDCKEVPMAVLGPLRRVLPSRVWTVNISVLTGFGTYWFRVPTSILVFGPLTFR